MSRDATAGGTPATPDALLRAPGFLARRLYQAYSAAWVRTVDAHLTGPQFAVLTAVEVHPEVDQGSLASAVALDRSTMADVCRRLEERSLLRRSTAPADGRRKLLSLTEDGARRLREVRSRAQALDGELLRDHDDAERHRLLADLTRLSEAWEAIAERPRAG